MNTVFNAEEVLEIAVQIEQRGAAFYRRAAELVDVPAVKEMLEDLAAMEENHEVGFETMRAAPEILTMLLGDPEGEVVRYLSAFADGTVFPPDEDPAALLDHTESVAAILSKAITMELKSIAFYQGIADVMSTPIGREKVESIIREERRHVAMLSAKRATLR